MALNNSAQFQTNTSRSDTTISSRSTSEVHKLNQTDDMILQNEILTPVMGLTCHELDISPNIGKYLRKLQDFEFVFVIDDSGSMMTPVQNGYLTRWNEVCSMVKNVLKIILCFDPNGIELNFLNKKTCVKVTNPTEIDRLFADSPGGFTPLVPVLKKVFTSAVECHKRNKKLLVLVATDGELTDHTGKPNVSELKQLMNEQRQSDSTFVSFILCTDDIASVQYLTDWNRTMVNVDVTKRFLDERTEVCRYRGSDFDFTDGDYAVKVLVGSIDPTVGGLSRPSRRASTHRLNESPLDYNIERLDLADLQQETDGFAVISPISIPIETDSFRQQEQEPIDSIYRTMDDGLKKFSAEYDLQESMSKRLRQLRDYEIAIACDDSGSMKTPLDSSGRTRWDMLHYIVKLTFRVAIIFDLNGVDIHFINRGTYYDVKDLQTISEAFAVAPSGYTSLAPLLSKIFKSDKAQPKREKKLLVFVVTDGLPTNNHGDPNVEQLKSVMENVRNASTTYVSFLLCSDEPEYINYLNDWDRNMPNVDVTDHFHAVRENVRRIHGPNFPFSIDDYIVKALVGAIDREIDNIDDPIEHN